MWGKRSANLCGPLAKWALGRKVGHPEMWSALSLWRLTAYSPGNKRVSRLFPVITDGAKRRYLLGSNPANSGAASPRLGRKLSSAVPKSKSSCGKSKRNRNAQAHPLGRRHNRRSGCGFYIRWIGVVRPRGFMQHSCRRIPDRSQPPSRLCVGAASHRWLDRFDPKCRIRPVKSLRSASLSRPPGI